MTIKKDSKVKKEVLDDLYIMLNPDNSLFKIGRSKHPNKRLQTIKSSSGSEVELLRVFKGKGFLEKTIHEAMREYRVRGEWFNKCNGIDRLLSIKSSIGEYKK